MNQGEENCPRCRSWTVVPKEQVVVSGERVSVSAVVLHGKAVGLLDKNVRKGMDILNLGERCKHGFITYRICPQCYQKNS